MGHLIMELYSGIGGMHCAWIESGLQGEVVAAVDINTVANEVYKHNFQNTPLLNRNIQALKADELKNFKFDTILMSPPCQPFTRNGKYLDKNDPRTASLLHLIDTIDELDNLEYILMENVKGFESSTVRKIFIDKLTKCNFQYQEFLICPSTVGVPNSRLRYYCIARRSKKTWSFRPTNEIMHHLPQKFEEPFCLKQIIEDNADDFLVPDKLLKRGNILDICHSESKRSCCFTKAYSHYVEGTGSVFTDASPKLIEVCYKNANNFSQNSEDFIAELRPLHLRFFTPTEVLLLMSFPNKYKFPKNITRKQCYRLLGNSVNVKVITELIKLLYS